MSIWSEVATDIVVHKLSWYTATVVLMFIVVWDSTWSPFVTLVYVFGWPYLWFFGPTGRFMDKHF